MSWYDLLVLYTEQGKQENVNNVEQQILESALEHLNFIHILLFYFFKIVILLFSKTAFHWSKVTAKKFIILQKFSISNQICSFEIYIQRILKMYQGFH